jgi:hypothetical protein
MDKRDNIKKKIKALLAKTTENGATEAEALAALEKAHELMMENFISEHEITDPYIAEQCVFKTIEKIKSGYNIDVFYATLCRLFDCKHYYTTANITFFGFEEDAELCAYFYGFIIKACLNKKNKYMRSREYKALSLHYSGRSLAASFIRGFMVGICRKMQEMYECRKDNLTPEVGLMVIQKEQLVKKQFEESNIKARSVGIRKGKYEAQAFLNGVQQGQDTRITQGINQHKQDSMLQLNK